VAPRHECAHGLPAASSVRWAPLPRSRPHMCSAGLAAAWPPQCCTPGRLANASRGRGGGRALVPSVGKAQACAYGSVWQGHPRIRSRTHPRTHASSHSAFGLRMPSCPSCLRKQPATALFVAATRRPWEDAGVRAGGVPRATFVAHPGPCVDGDAREALLIGDDSGDPGGEVWMHAAAYPVGEGDGEGDGDGEGEGVGRHTGTYAPAGERYAPRTGPHAGPPAQSRAGAGLPLPSTLTTPMAPLHGALSQRTSAPVAGPPRAPGTLWLSSNPAAATIVAFDDAALLNVADVATARTVRAAQGRAATGPDLGMLPARLIPDAGAPVREAASRGGCGGDRPEGELRPVSIEGGAGACLLAAVDGSGDGGGRAAIDTSAAGMYVTAESVIAAAPTTTGAAATSAAVVTSAASSAELASPAAAAESAELRRMVLAMGSELETLRAQVLAPGARPAPAPPAQPTPPAGTRAAASMIGSSAAVSNGGGYSTSEEVAALAAGSEPVGKGRSGSPTAALPCTRGRHGAAGDSASKAALPPPSGATLGVYVCVCVCMCVGVVPRTLVSPAWHGGRDSVVPRPR
jgi:hypothetical protein